MNTHDAVALVSSGVIVLDRHFTLIAVDRGAGTILSTAAVPDGCAPRSGGVPHTVLTLLSNDTIARNAPVRGYVRIGQRDYLCRAYYLQSTGSAPDNTSNCQPVVVIHLSRTATATVTIDEACNTYHLTGREKQILSGLSSMGLTNKELAERLNISCNTVKLFVRILIIKMGVKSRAGLVAKLLDRGPCYSEEVALKDAV